MTLILYGIFLGMGAGTGTAGTFYFFHETADPTRVFALRIS